MHPLRFTLSPKPGHLRQTAFWSTWDGVFYQMFFALSAVGTPFFTAYCLSLGMNDAELSVIAAVNQLSLMLQLVGLRVLQKSRGMSRRSLVMILAGLARFTVVILALLPFLLPPEWNCPAVLILIFLSGVGQSLAGNIWTEWMSDSVPKSIRGRFFARRSIPVCLAGVAIGFGAGLLLDCYDRHPGTLGGWLASQGGDGLHTLIPSRDWLFCGFFVTAAVFSCLSVLMLSRQPERRRPQNPLPGEEYGIDPFALALRHPGFRRLLLLGGGWSFAIGIGNQFWSPYMQRELHLSLMEQQLYALISLVGTLGTLAFWGRAIDRFGNRPTMTLACSFAILNPLCWIFVSPSSYQLIFFEAFSAGFAAACINLCQFNFVLSLTGPRERQAAAGIYAAFCGFCLMLGILISGKLLPEHGLCLFGLAIDRYQILFLASALCRGLALCLLLRIPEAGARPLREFLGSLGSRQRAPKTPE
ncbi:MAG: putative rane protein [Verrucomicrobiota bacterium]|jgi:MFS family permease